MEDHDHTPRIQSTWKYKYTVCSRTWKSTPVLYASVMYFCASLRQLRVNTDQWSFAWIVPIESQKNQLGPRLQRKLRINLLLFPPPPPFSFPFLQSFFWPFGIAIIFRKRSDFLIDFLIHCASRWPENVKSNWNHFIPTVTHPFSPLAALAYEHPISNNKGFSSFVIHLLLRVSLG